MAYSFSIPAVACGQVASLRLAPQPNVQRAAFDDAQRMFQIGAQGVGGSG